MKKIKKGTKVTTTTNFVITEIKDGELVVNTKTYDWKVSLAPGTSHHLIMKHYVENNTLEEVNQILNLVYATTTTMLTDMKLTNTVLKYFKAIEETELIEVTEDSEKEDIKIVKEIEDGKEH